MVGLRTQEDCKFTTFFDLVQKEAAKSGCVFFLDTGEGHSEFGTDMICTDCSGWLVPKDKSEDFRKDFENFNEQDSWEDFAAWVTWQRKAGKVSVKIERL